MFKELEDGRFDQTPLSEPLRSNAKPCVRNMAMMLTDDWHIRSWEQLPWCVETGKPASYKLNGMPMFDWMAQHPEKTVNFNNAMTDMSQGDAGAVVQSYDFSRFEHIVDVAGGHGTLLAAILDQAVRVPRNVVRYAARDRRCQEGGYPDALRGLEACCRQEASLNRFRRTLMPTS